MQIKIIPDLPPVKSKSVGAGLVVIRVAVVLLFLYYQGWHLGTQAVQHLWKKESWDLAERLDHLGIPFSNTVTVSAVALTAILHLGLVVGLYTRFFSFAWAVLLVLALIFQLPLSPASNAQSLLLYLTMCLGLVFAGSGKYSLDHLTTRKKVDDQN